MIKLTVFLCIKFKPLDWIAERFVSLYLKHKNISSIESERQKRLAEEACRLELKRIANGEAVKTYPIPKR